MRDELAGLRREFLDFLHFVRGNSEHRQGGNRRSRFSVGAGGVGVGGVGGRIRVRGYVEGSRRSVGSSWVFVGKGRVCVDGRRFCSGTDRTF